MRIKIAGILFFGGGSGLTITMLLGLSWEIYGGQHSPPPDWLFYPMPPFLACIGVGIALAIWDDIATTKLR